MTRMLVSALEADALATEIDELWLLTLDKSEFFRRLGYALQDRDLAPEVIKATREFSGLCPSDAMLMSKVLARSN